MKINEALLEKEQISTELNSMERSFSDLFKRLEKYKDVIDGYKKVRIDRNVVNNFSTSVFCDSK